MAVDNLTQTFKTDIAHVGDFIRSSSGDLQTLSGLPNVKNALFHRLVTVPGTLVHKPLYGIGVGLYQNAPSSFSIQQKLATLIQEQFEQDPRVESVNSVSITSEDGTPQSTVIAVSVNLIGYGEQAMTFTPFSEANS